MGIAKNSGVRRKDSKVGKKNYSINVNGVEAATSECAKLTWT